MNGENPSIEAPANRLEVNKVLRVLNGKPQKYTVHLLMKDGSERQIQSMVMPSTVWNAEIRCELLVFSIPKPPPDSYGTFEVPICRFDEVAIIQTEENPI